MLTMSTFSLLHEKNNFASQFFVIISYYRFTYENRQALVRASTRDAYNLYSVNFLNHRFHTIGKYVQNYRYRLSTDTANIGPMPIPIIGQSLRRNIFVYNKSFYYPTKWMVALPHNQSIERFYPRYKTRQIHHIFIS